MKLRDIAHSRTGDKGRLVTISLIAYREEDFELLESHVTAERVAQFFSSLIEGPVDRYVLPALDGMIFVLRRPDNLSVTRSLALDAHGKCLGSALLAMDLDRSN